VSLPNKDMGIETRGDALRHRRAHADASLCCRCGAPIAEGEPVWMVPARLFWFYEGFTVYKTVRAAACRRCGEPLFRRLEALERRRMADHMGALELGIIPRGFHDPPTVLCLGCGRVVHLPRRYDSRRQERSLLCSDRCRNRLYGARFRGRHPRPKKPVPARACAACGRDFTPGRADARTCSAACRQKAHRQRRVTNRNKDDNLLS
jgi:hypothetical protein